MQNLYISVLYCTVLYYFGKMIHEDETAADRGRIAAHDLPVTTAVWRAENRRKIKMLKAYQRSNHKSRLYWRLFQRRKKEARRVGLLIMKHHASYDKVNRAHVVFTKPPLGKPWEELSERAFYNLFGFNKDNFLEIAQALELIPATVRDPLTRCRCEKKLALCIMLRRWALADTWKEVEECFRIRRCKLIRLYKTIIRLLAASYRRCLKILDFRRIMPLLDGWSALLAGTIGCNPNCLFAVDGKAEAYCTPGTGAFATRIANVANVCVNLIQRFFYNGHYALHGACLPLYAHGGRMYHAVVPHVSLLLFSLLARPWCTCVGGGGGGMGRLSLDRGQSAAYCASRFNGLCP